MGQRFNESLNQPEFHNPPMTAASCLRDNGAGSMHKSRCSTGCSREGYPLIREPAQLQPLGGSAWPLMAWRHHGAIILTIPGLDPWFFTGFILGIDEDHDFGEFISLDERWESSKIGVVLIEKHLPSGNWKKTYDKPSINHHQQTSLTIDHRSTIDQLSGWSQSPIIDKPSLIINHSSFLLSLPTIH